MRLYFRTHMLFPVVSKWPMTMMLKGYVCTYDHSLSFSLSFFMHLSVSFSLSSSLPSEVPVTINLLKRLSKEEEKENQGREQNLIASISAFRSAPHLSTLSKLHIPAFLLSQATEAYLAEKNVTHLFPEGSWERIMINKCRDPRLLSIKPKKADAILFYSQLPDGRADRSSLHGGCPVINVRQTLGPFTYILH